MPPWGKNFKNGKLDNTYLSNNLKPFNDVRNGVSLNSNCPIRIKCHLHSEALSLPAVLCGKGELAWNPGQNRAHFTVAKCLVIKHCLSASFVFLMPLIDHS